MGSRGQFETVKVRKQTNGNGSRAERSHLHSQTMILRARGAAQDLWSEITRVDVLTADSTTDRYSRKNLSNGTTLTENTATKLKWDM